MQMLGELRQTVLITLLSRHAKPAAVGFGRFVSVAAENKLM